MKYILALGILVLAGCQSTVSPQGSGTTAPIAATQSTSMVTLLNQQRAAQGLGPVRINARLSRASVDHARDMATNNYFSHQGRNGSTFVQRAQAAGYNCVAAENLAVGQTTEAAVVTAWMNSAGHRRNILTPDATEFGVGRVGNTWVVMFGRGC